MSKNLVLQNLNCKFWSSIGNYPALWWLFHVGKSCFFCGLESARLLWKSKRIGDLQIFWCCDVARVDKHRTLNLHCSWNKAIRNWCQKFTLLCAFETFFSSGLSLIFKIQIHGIVRCYVWMLCWMKWGDLWQRKTNFKKFQKTNNAWWTSHGWSGMGYIEIWQGGNETISKTALFVCGILCDKNLQLDDYLAKVGKIQLVYYINI